MVIAGLIGVALVWTQYKNLPKLSNVKLEIKAYIKSMLAYGTPLSLSAIISGFQGQYYAFLLPIFYVTDNTAIGNYGIANNFRRSNSVLCNTDNNDAVSSIQQAQPAKRQRNSAKRLPILSQIRVTPRGASGGARYVSS